MSTRSSYRWQATLAPHGLSAGFSRALHAVAALSVASVPWARLGRRVWVAVVRVGLAGVLLMLGGMLVPLFA